MKHSVGLLVLLAVLAVSMFGGARPVLAAPELLPPTPPPDCIFPWFPHIEKIAFGSHIPYPLYNGFTFDLLCGLAGGIGLVAPVEIGHAGQFNLSDGWVSATINGIPGVPFKAFMYQVVPQPQDVPEGWYIYGYGVSIFYDNGEVAPEGLVCWALPPGVFGNFELGVFEYKNGEFLRLSKNSCGYFLGGGQFFLLMQTDPVILLGGPTP